MQEFRPIDCVEALQERMRIMRAAQREFSKFTQEQVDHIFFEAAMAANKALAASARPFAVIPTPRAVSAGCGMSLRFVAADGAEARAVAASLVHVQGTAALYRVEGTSFQLVDRL